MYLTEKEYQKRLAELHTENLKRSVTPTEEQDVNKSYWAYKNEMSNLQMQRYLQQQAEKEAEKEIEEKAADFISENLEDLFSGFFDKSRNTSKKMEFTINI